MEDDALLDQFSMTFDLLPLQGQDSKNDDALLEQFSMNFDLSPLATEKGEATEEEKAKKQKIGNKRVQQTKKTKREKSNTASDKEAEDENNQKANKGKRTMSQKSIEGVYVCNICHKDLGKRKSIYMHMRIKHKKTWKGSEQHGVDDSDFDVTKVKCKENEVQERINDENKADMKADDKEADNENTKTKEEEETENEKVKDQKIPNKNENKEAKKVKMENNMEERGGSEENKADIKKENVSTFLDKTQKVAEDKKKERKWKKGIEGVYICSICTADLGNRLNIQNHMKKKHNTLWKPEKKRKWKKGIEGVYICSICTEDLGNRFNIRNHMKRKHNTLWKPEKKKATKIIKSEIKTEDTKTDVTKKKNKKKKNEFQEGIHWKLDQSKNGENYTENAWVNVKKNKNTKSVNTLKIKKKLKQNPTIVAKVRKWKKGKTGVYICTLCDKDNGNKFNLQYHMKINHNEIWQQEREKRMKEPRWKKGVAGFFICEFCEKDCGNRINLSFHRRTKHTTEWQQIKMKNISMEKKKVEDKEKQPHHVPVKQERNENKHLQNNTKSIKKESRFTLQVPLSRPLSPLKPRTKKEGKDIMGNSETLNQILKKAKKTIIVSPASPKLSIQDKTELDALPCYACLACYEKDCVDCVWCSGKKTGRRTNKCLTNKCLNPVPRNSMQEKEPLTLMEGQPFAFCPIKRNPPRRNPSSEKADTAYTDEQWSDVKLQTKFDHFEEEKSISSHVQLNKEEPVSLEETDLATSYILASQDREESTNNEVEADTPNQELNFEGSHQLKANESTSQKYSPNVSCDAPSVLQDQDTSIENAMNVECAEEYITFSNSGTFTEDSSQTLEEQGNFVHENQTETQELQETNEFTNVEEGSPHDSEASQFIAAENLHLPKTGDSLEKELEPLKKNEDIENTHLNEKSEDANQPSVVSVDESSGTYTLCRAEDGSLYVLKS